MSTSKLINFKNEGLVIAIQAYADTHTEGNFSMAVRELLKTTLNKPA